MPDREWPIVSVATIVRSPFGIGNRQIMTNRVVALEVLIADPGPVRITCTSNLMSTDDDVLKAIQEALIYVLGALSKSQWMTLRGTKGIKSAWIDSVPYTLVFREDLSPQRIDIGCGKIVEGGSSEFPFATMSLTCTSPAKTPDGYANDAWNGLEGFLLYCSDRLDDRSHVVEAVCQRPLVRVPYTPVSLFRYDDSADSYRWVSRYFRAQVQRHNIHREWQCADSSTWLLLPHDNTETDWFLHGASMTDDTEMQFSVIHALSILAGFAGSDWQVCPGWCQRRYSSEGLTYTLLLETPKVADPWCTVNSLRIDFGGLLSFAWAAGDTQQASLKGAMGVWDKIIARCQTTLDDEVAVLPLLEQH